MVELGHPEQLPSNLTVTIPFLNSLNFISPPSLSTAGLILVSKIFIICLSISIKFSSDLVVPISLSITNLILEIYKDLGFENIILKYSDKPEVRVGEDKVWDKAEEALLKAVKATKLDYSINKGEGAFYGPKIDFVLRDAIGRDWQCGTLQVDLNLQED